MSGKWNQILNVLKNTISEDDIDEWLSKAEVLNDDHILEIGFQDTFVEWIRETYYEPVCAAAQQIDQPPASIVFCGLEQVGQPKPASPQTGLETAPETTGTRRRGTKLNPKYVFDRFVVGESNRFADAAAKAVAEHPSTNYNPLYIYGGSGLGKTHLLHATGNELLRTRKDLNICYNTCEEFTNQFINSIRFNKGEVFRERYRSVDVLLIDDIQFLSGKQQTQEEFFHTFNALFEQQKQIILSSDRQPSDIENLEDRLISRFQWGLLADIQPPALETRIAILREKARNENVALGDDVILYIASRVKSNVRELEGALIKLVAYASLGRRKINLELAEQCLRHYVQGENAAVSVEKIQKFIAERFSISTKDLTAKNNARKVAVPRQIAMYLTRQLTDMSLPEIGDAFGKKHHSTVLYSIKKISKRLETDVDFKTTITGYQKALD